MTAAYLPLLPRTAGLLRLLRRRIIAAHPLAAALAHEPTLADRTDTFPDDHAAAAVLVAISRLLHALDDWLEPGPDPQQ